MNEVDIKQFLSQRDYDIRKTKNGRWIDQKCTMDVVCLVADCVIEYVKQYPSSEFTVNDIWFSEYAVRNVQEIFSKPNPTDKARCEYDKYFGQPIKMMAAAGILTEIKRGKRNFYTVANMELLEYISFRERNSFIFLCLYIEKTLKDSDIYWAFERFFTYQNPDTYQELRDVFIRFTIANTPINKPLECGRIFTKVLNPLACKYRKCGTVSGRCSDDVITQDMILYNQRNWRDILSEKPKDQTRDEHESHMPSRSEEAMAHYRIERAKKNLRDFNYTYRDGRTELYEERHMSDAATHMHHIFPAHEYPEIADYLENLIALTPTQHLVYAHPNNRTLYISKDYQYLCLVAKTGSIKQNLLSKYNEPKIYDFYLYIDVLNTGFETDEFDEVENMNFNQVLNLIEQMYA